MTAQTTVIPSFRVANQEDVTALVDLVQLAYRGGKSTVGWKNENDLVSGPRITASQMKELVDESAKTILIAELPSNEPQMVGCILVEDHPDDAHIGMFAVNPDLQNIGLGKALVQAAEDYAVKTLGKTRATMCVISTRAELLGWYGRMGYERTGQTEPFFGPESGQKPLQENLYFVEIAKKLA